MYKRQAKRTYTQCVFIEKEEEDYGISKSFEAMLQNPDFYQVLKEVVNFGIARYQKNYSGHYQDTELVLYEKYTYEDVCRLLKW